MTNIPFIDPFLFGELFKKKDNSSNSKSESSKPRILRIRSRGSIIYPSFVHRSFGVHNGRKFLRVKITKAMVGHKLGEFALTRQKHVYKSKKKGTKR